MFSKSLRFANPILALSLILTAVVAFPFFLSAYFLYRGSGAIEELVATEEGLVPQPSSQPSGSVEFRVPAVPLSQTGRNRLTTALTYLEQAIRWDKHNARAYLDLAYGYLLQDNREAALRTWVAYRQLRPDETDKIDLLRAILAGPNSPRRDASSLGRLGLATSDIVATADLERRDGHVASALELYGAAIELDPGASTAWYQIGDYCTLMAISKTLQIARPERLCQQYFEWNQGNLIVNGGAEGGQIGWLIYSSSGEEAVFNVDRTVSHTGQASALVESKSPKYHGGWYQRLPVTEGTDYLYSAWIKTESLERLQVQALYLQWSEGGRPVGHAENVLTGNRDWTYVETTIRGPRSDDGVLLIYPTLVTGRGRVWVDDVRLLPLASAR